MMNRTTSLIAALAATLTLTSAGAAQAQSSPKPAVVDYGGESELSQSFVLPLNKAAVVELPRGAADVLVSQPEVVDAVIRSPRRVYLLGRRVGQANAFFFDGQGRQILNLEIQVERDLDILSGIFERLMPDARITPEAVNDTVVLRGVVQNATEAANAARIAARFIDDEEKVIPLMAIRDSEQVMLKVRIVEMQRSVVKQLGVDLSGQLSLADGTSVNPVLSTIAPNTNIGGLGAVGSAVLGSGNNQTLNASLVALEQVGLVRTLAEPNLTAVSGESANFLAGGEFPIPVGQEDGVVSIEFKEFGVGLGFTPVVLSKGRINLKVSTEVSELTTENGFTIAGGAQQVTVPGSGNDEPPFLIIDTDGDGTIETIPNPNFQPDQVQTVSTTGLTIPGLSTRRAKTTVELPSGGSLVMAGLLQEDMRQTINGLPFLRNTPILGQLFRSRDYQNDETELVIIVTPYLVRPTDRAKLTDPSEGFVPASDLQAALLGKMVSAYGLQGSSVGEKTLQGPLGFILD
ncbi:MAG: type II and III secretion system protein family protein [Pseudomonadota bacterium]